MPFGYISVFYKTFKEEKELRKLLGVLLAVTLVGSMLAGCGGKAEEPATEPAAIEPADTSFDEAAHANANLPDASGDPAVTIIFSGGSFDSMNEAEAVFKNAIENLSGGSITIDWHPKNELGGDKEIIESVSMGNVDMGLTSPAAVTTMMPNLSIFDAYYVINDQETAYAAMDGEIGDQLAKDAEELGMKLVAWCENGFRNLTCKVDVKSMADLKGIKIRTMENTLQMEAWKALGTNPTPMSFGDVFTALQNGTIDAQENPLGIIFTNSFMDVQDYLVLSQHVYTPMPIYINMNKYNSMTDNQKAVYDYCVEYMETWQRARNLEMNDLILANLKATGTNVIELNDETIKEFQDAINNAGVYDLVRDEMTNPELLDKLMELAK
jgi:tripartite ATP-independent transporter DctP family solute receptor